MTLRVPNLDDRKFQDIVDETKQRIAEHCPEWTNHNVSDPGVTLVELFAYMTELTLYRLNQVPDRLYSVFLNMVGIEPYSVVPARTDLVFRITPQADEALLPPRIEVSTQTDEDGQIVFMTNESLLLRSPRLVGCMTRAPEGPHRNRWDVLKFSEKSVTCFEPLEVGAATYFAFAEPLSRHVIRLRISAETLGRGIEPERPPIRWEISTEKGWAEATQLGDETGGLNRDGEIELKLPAGHALLPIEGVEAFWVRLTLDEHEADRSYSRSPAIRTLEVETIGGVVSSFHGEPIPAEVLGTSDGTPGQRFQVSRAPVLSPRWEGEEIRVVTDEGSEVWDEVDHFGYSHDHDRHVVWHPAAGEVEFGPAVRHPGGGSAQRGAIPPKGAQIMVTAYRTGGGLEGNVPAGSLRVMRTSVPFVQRVTNLEAATGGEDAETDEAARKRAPVTLRAGRRAVTTGDYARLAVEASGAVARAHCVDRRQGLPVVRVLLVPAVAGEASEHTIDDFVLDPQVHDEVIEFLDERRLVGTSVQVGTPYYEGVSIVAKVTAVTGADTRVIEQRCREALYRFTHPICGGPDGDGVQPGWTLTEEKARQMLAAIEGVAAVDDVVLFAADLRRGERIVIGQRTPAQAATEEGQPAEGITLEEDAIFLGFKHEVVVR